MPSAEHGEPLFSSDGVHWLRRTRPWLVPMSLPWQGSRLFFLAGALVVLEPPCLRSTEGVGPSDGILLGTECLWPMGTLGPVHGLTHLCTYPNVLF